MKTLLLLLTMIALPALAQNPSRILGTGDGPAAVLYLSTPEGARVATRGQVRPGGRNTRADDRFAIASLSKLYLSVALLMAQERGLVDLDAPAARYLPPEVVIAFGRLDGITTRHLLAMTSGLPDYLDDDYILRMARGQMIDARRAAWQRAARYPRMFAPGADFDYSNTNYVLAEMVLEQVTGQSMAISFEEMIFTPLGLTRTAHHGPMAQPDVLGREVWSGLRPDDIARYYGFTGLADGGLIAPAAEVAAFYRALFIDQTLLSGTSLDEMLRDAVSAGYGLGVEVETIPGLGIVLGHSGGDLGFVSDVRLVLNRDVIVVALVADADGPDELTYDVLDRLD